MSYHANGYGYVIAKDDAPKREIERILGKVFSGICFWGDDKDSEVSFDGNYDEDSVYQVLQGAGPYLRKYRISFEGEDRARWILSKSDDGSSIHHNEFLRKLVEAGYAEKEAEKILGIIGL